MELPHCPRCGENLVQQSPRQGMIEALGGFFCIYPFRCQLCTHRFLAIQWWWSRFVNYYGRREYVRIPVRFQLTFSGREVSGEGTVVNLSRKGCTMETDTPIPHGEILRLRIYERDGRKATGKLDTNLAFVMNHPGLLAEAAGEGPLLPHPAARRTQITDRQAQPDGRAFCRID